MDKPIMDKLQRTCIACPSQWECSDKKGHFYYFRYRWGCLKVLKSNKITIIIPSIKY